MRPPFRMFVPHALVKPWTKREGYIVNDTSMPSRDWSRYDEPSHVRLDRKVKVEFLLPALSLPQAA